MRHAGGDGGSDVVPGLVQRLIRQRVHQVEIDALEMRLRQVDGAARLVAGMDASERGEFRIVETLDAERKPIHAGGAIGSKTCGLDGAGVGFERDLGIGQERHAHADCREQRIDGFARHQAGRAAADEDRDDRAAPDHRQRGFEVGDQRGEISRFLRLALIRAN